MVKYAPRKVYIRERECEHCDTEIHPHGLCEKAGMAHSKNVCGRWLFWYKFPKTKFPEYDKRH